MDCILKNDRLTVTVSDRGAELRSLLGADGTEYLWQGDARYWAGRSPVLFPITGRVIGGKYTWEGRTYSMDLHGFSRNRIFRTVRSEEDSLLFMSEDDDATYASYPRRFSFSVGYTLNGNVLKVTYTVINEDEKEMLFGLGGHPGFNVPLVPDKTFEDSRLRFREPCTPKRVLLENAFCTGELAAYPLDGSGSIQLDTELFRNDGIFLTDHTPAIVLETPGEGHSVTVSAEDMPYVGFWKPYDKDAHFICIEPWWSLPSGIGEKTVFEEQKALIRLAPGHVFRRSWSITVDRPAAACVK